MSDTKTSLKITDHALVRYLERCRGLDVEMIKQEMLSERISTAIEELGDGVYTIQNRFTAVVKNKCLITVYKRDGK